MAEVAYKKRLLTVEDYLEMGRQGILRPDEHVELIHGEIVVIALLPELGLFKFEDVFG